MSLDVVYPLAQACVWMEAGVLRFWLCNHDFECERCPLDLALRGVTLTELATPQPQISPLRARKS